MADPNNAHARPPQQQSYPSPHSYPSPSMAPSTYNYPPPQNPSSESYRRSPSSSSAQLGSLNLPPIRAIDGQGQSQPAQQQPGQPVMGSPLPPPHAPPTMGGYYQSGGGQSMGLLSGQMATSPPRQMPIPTMHYPRMPPQQGADQRMMSGGRHKKEIKRRTKTGCLTCRKRRIKCDEAHPVCRNCQKSKRECAGYDPIFKPQPGPAQIQPAPASAASSSSIPSSAPHLPPPTYSNAPPGYAPAAAGGYPQQPVTAAPVSATTDLHHDHNSFIDPALAAEHNNMAHDGTQGRAMNGPLTNAQFLAAQRIQVKQCKIEDIFAISNVPVMAIPPGLSVPTTEAEVEQVKDLFLTDYAPGLDSLLETRWYSTEGFDELLRHRETLSLLLFLMQQFSIHQQQQQQQLPADHVLAGKIASLEAKVIWSLLSLCRHADSNGSATLNGTPNAPSDSDPFVLREVRGRLAILETLLTGHILEANPLLSLAYEHELQKPKFLETEFWKHLGVAVSQRNDSGSAAREIEGALAAMRAVLDQKEARDVIYSIAILRHCGVKMAREPGQVQDPSVDNSETDRNKVMVAARFLMDECAQGMTIVISRVAGMSFNFWSLPGGTTQ